MIQIPLAAVPNQSFTFQSGEILFDLSLKFRINFMAVDISINNQSILSGSRCVPGFPLIPYRYLENGNFLIVTANNEYPIYTQFGITQFLYYATQTELETFRAALG